LQRPGKVVGVAEVEVFVQLKARQQKLAISLLCCSFPPLSCTTSFVF